ncbi:MAG: NADH-quinone oxidoreductase subunit C [Caldilineales bacterium]
MTDVAPATVAEPVDTIDFRDVEAQLRARFPAAVQDVERAHGEVDFTVTAGSLLDVARYLRDEPGLEFVHLADVTGLDRSQLPARQRSRPGDEARFAGIYHLYSISGRRHVRLTVPAGGLTTSRRCPASFRCGNRPSAWSGRRMTWSACASPGTRTCGAS